LFGLPIRVLRGIGTSFAPMTVKGLDAVDFQAPPGTVGVIEGGELRGLLDTKLSVHQIGLPDMLFAAAFSGIAPPEMCLVGIQPGKIETGLLLTQDLQENFQAFLDAALARLDKWGVSPVSS